MPGRRLPHLGRAPGHQAALLELHHVVLPDLTAAQRHREYVADLPDALPGVRRAQVVVTVPARLLSRVRDQLEDPLRPGRDLTARADHARRLLLGCHAPIQAPLAWLAGQELADRGPRALRLPGRHGVAAVLDPSTRLPAMPRPKSSA